MWILTATKCATAAANEAARFAVGVGVGCDRGSSAASIALAVETALTVGGIGADAVSVIASSEHKADEAGLREFAAGQGWPLHFFAASELDGVTVPNPSPQALQHAGSASVAEAAARLAAAGGDLLVGKQKFRGADGKHVTVAIARLSTTDLTTAPSSTSGAV
ncbi:cobalamin biosynthesis protein [Rhodocyclus tenuis]|uniref:cobalamin biosynthesis protein n=1 Tax=Rhodocyclus tenuis TaxID=1066 RepID=UPI001D17D6FB|nr:cobalamin biosynthesis protein [Rhodocyclus tenuis]